MRVTKGGPSDGKSSVKERGKMRGEGDQGDRGSPDTTRSREIRPFQVWLMPAGKVNECNCAGTSPFLFFRLLFHFSLFLSFFLPRNPVSLFFLTTGSSDPSPFPRPAIAVNLSVHARIRRGQIESGKFESVTSKLLRLKGYKLAIGKLTSMSRFTGNIPNYSRIYSQVNYVAFILI